MTAGSPHHTAANADLAEIADRNGILLPDQLKPEHEVMREQLEELDDNAFDLAYMQGQVIDHQKTITLLIWEIGSGQDAQSQQFAARTLPTVIDHLSQAREILANLPPDRAADQ